MGRWTTPSPSEYDGNLKRGPPCSTGREALSEFRQIVRLRGQDISGAKNVLAALASISGIGWNLARAICHQLKIDVRLRLGQLKERELAALEEALKDPSALKLPGWMYNRQRNPETGSTLHLTGSDLELAVKADIKRERDMQSWRGVRHSLGLKVRGQRTKTTGRKGPAVGVRKKAVAPGEQKAEG
ncbi:MAG: 30S ribosomal protein S13 [Nitrososphaerota archaeon]